MSWILKTWFAASFFGLSLEHDNFFQGYELSSSGYHLCSENLTETTSKVIPYQISYSVRMPCGGWLPWKMCQRTLYKMGYRTIHFTSTKSTFKCCDGYEQVNNYCALPFSRTVEFTAKPGHCPATQTGIWGPRCEWDTDCPGWQKCCEANGYFYCASPVASERRWCLNVSVVVRMSFYDMHSLDKAILNHTRLLHSVITGALGLPAVSVHHVHSCLEGPSSTASRLLVCSSLALSLSESATRLQPLPSQIEEISAVEVQDTDECAEAALNCCSPDAICINTEGTYRCTCQPGFIDMNVSNAGVHCRASQRPTNRTRSKLARLNSNEVIVASTQRTQDNLTGNHMLLPNASDPWMTQTTGPPELWAIHSPSSQSTALTMKTGTLLLQGTPANLQSSNSTPNSSSDTASFRNSPPGVTPQHAAPATGCPAAITNVMLVNVTGSSFYVTWAVNSTASHTFRVEVLEMSVLVSMTQTGYPAWGVTGLEPGVLYSVWITPLACGAQGVPVRQHVRTAAQTMSATARLSNLVFKETFLNLSSQDYISFCHSFKREILSSLSPDIQALVNSSVVRIHIWGLAQGSVIVNFGIVFSPDNSLNITDVSHSILISLQSSSPYNLEFDITDFDECSQMADDCSAFATCQNTLGSYTCVCNKEYRDTNPDWPGRTCAAIAVTTPPSPPATTASTVHADFVPTGNSPKTTLPSLEYHTPGLSLAEAIGVKCRANKISVTILKEFLQARNITESSLYLGTPSCGVSRGNASHVELTATLGMCNMEFLNNNTHNIAQIKLFNNLNTAPARKTVLAMPVMCIFSNSMLISTGYSPIGYNMIKNVVEGTGTFYVRFQLFNGSSPLSQNYTLSPNDEVIIEIGVNSTLPQIKIIINNCWATPNSDPLDSKKYTFLENSCPVSKMSTAVLANGNSSTSRLAIRIFSAVDESVIYLHCQIQICIETEATTCKTDCLTRSGRYNKMAGTGRASCGPIFKAPAVSGSTNVTGFHDVGYIILGVGLFLLCLLVVLASVFYYRNRIGRYTFSFRPKQEKVTYHIFDT
ncbi:uromodulin-like 1 [Brienomyrus brachyistius]|uniref:uromodulin-like 1 n=1 Tax=Brienomyrus brachyistius TaxID=42636 RepID=UPI0020B27FA5|nr:uromodulin-like 1 [Brienomyrus brachyistius]